MALLPVLFLSLGVAGYQGVMSRGEAGRAHGERPTAAASQKGPARPRYGQYGPPKGAEGGRVPVVAAHRVRLAAYRPQWSLYGEVVAGRRVAVHIPVPGRLVHVSPSLREGSMLKKGELLAAVEAFPYRAALEEAEAVLAEVRAKQREIAAQIMLERQGLEQARRQLEPARNEFERMQRLFDGGSVSQKMLDDAAVVLSQRELLLQQRQRNIEIISARLQQQEAVEKRQRWVLQRAERALEDTRLMAPFDAHVLSVNVEAGQYINSSDKLATLLSSGDVEVRFTLSEDQYGDLLASSEAIPGLPVEIIWRSGRTQQAFSGKVRRVAAEVAAESGAIVLYAGLGEAQEAKDRLPIGSFVDVMLSGRPIERVARIPESALYDRERVFLIEEDRLTVRRVQPLGWKNGEVLIAAGLNDGERILANHLPNARPGMAVRVVAQ